MTSPAEALDELPADRVHELERGLNLRSIAIVVAVGLLFLILTFALLGPYSRGLTLGLAALILLVAGIGVVAEIMIRTRLGRCHLRLGPTLVAAGQPVFVSVRWPPNARALLQARVRLVANESTVRANRKKSTHEDKVHADAPLLGVRSAHEFRCSGAALVPPDALPTLAADGPRLGRSWRADLVVEFVGVPTWTASVPLEVMGTEPRRRPAPPVPPFLWALLWGTIGAGTFLVGQPHLRSGWDELRWLAAFHTAPLVPAAQLASWADTGQPVRIEARAIGQPVVTTRDGRQLAFQWVRLIATERSRSSRSWVRVVRQAALAPGRLVLRAGSSLLIVDANRLARAPLDWRHMDLTTRSLSEAATAFIDLPVEGPPWFQASMEIAEFPVGSTVTAFGEVSRDVDGLRLTPHGGENGLLAVSTLDAGGVATELRWRLATERALTALMLLVGVAALGAMVLVLI